MLPNESPTKLRADNNDSATVRLRRQQWLMQASVCYPDNPKGLVIEDVKIHNTSTSRNLMGRGTKDPGVDPATEPGCLLPWPIWLYMPMGMHE
jgi:hypothetical protein